MIVYIRYSPNRKRRFQLSTQMVKRGKTLHVVKTAAHLEAEPFLNSLHEKYQLLNKPGFPFCVSAPIKDKNGGVSFEYLDAPSLTQKLLTLLRQQKRTEFRDLIFEYASTVRKIPPIPIDENYEFENVLGSAFPRDDSHMIAGVLDLNFENIFVIDGALHLTDYEWTFDFPLPSNFPIFRAIMGFYGSNQAYRPESLVPFAQLLQDLGISAAEQKRFLKYEAKFQEYVNEGRTAEDFLTVLHQDYEALESNQRLARYRQPIADLEQARKFIDRKEQEIAELKKYAARKEEDIQKLKAHVSGLEAMVKFKG